jgi:hypothetical protein
MDVDELQHALGGVVLESAFLERVRLLAALKACHQANSHRNRVIHDAWAARPGDVTVTLHGSRNSRDVTVTVRTPAEVRQVAGRLADAANEVKSAMTAAFGPGWDLVEDQLRQELGLGVGADYRGQRPDE